MSEETTTITPNNPFLDESWSGTPVIVEKEATQEAASEATASTEKPPEQVESATAGDKKKEGADTTVITNNESVAEPYYKKWGFEKEEDVESEITTLREKASKAFEYKNEESKRIAEYINEGKEDELYEFFSNKKKVEKLSTADLSDKNVAAELVKFGIKNDNKDAKLSDDEVEFIFNEKYPVLPKPVKDDLEDEDDYNIKLGAWETQKANIEKRMVIEAKMAQPKMAQLKSELVLPDIQREVNQNANQPSQEELDRMESLRKNFLTKLESDYKNFNGFETLYKDEDVEIPVSFSFDDTEKSALKTELEDFDVNGFIESRWFKDGVPDVTRMMKDISLLRNEEKVFSKIANEVGSKMREHIYKVKANVSVTGEQQSFQPNGEKTQRDKEIEYIWQNG